jgi:hypothetical protein
LETSKLRRIISGINIFINAKIYNMITKVSLGSGEKISFYLYPLLKQPEALVDGGGKYYDDKLIRDRNIASQLEDDEYLVVKEHSNAIGDRGYGFYKQLTSYPGVLLIDEKVNTKILMGFCLGVYTVSGTAALEASLRGVNGYCFSDVYFRNLECCNVVTLNDFNAQYSDSKIQASCSLTLTSKQFVIEILMSTCDGIISNLRSDAHSMSSENISKVADEFIGLLKQ